MPSTRNGLRAALGVRTPGFGWLTFLLDRAQDAGLGSHLTSLSSTMSVRADGAQCRDDEQKASA